MKEYRRGAHTVYEIHLHVVWTTKYRQPVLTALALCKTYPPRHRRRQGIAEQGVIIPAGGGRLGHFWRTYPGFMLSSRLC